MSILKFVQATSIPRQVSSVCCTLLTGMKSNLYCKVITKYFPKPLQLPTNAHMRVEQLFPGIKLHVHPAGPPCPRLLLPKPDRTLQQLVSFSVIKKCKHTLCLQMHTQNKDWTACGHRNLVDAEQQRTVDKMLNVSTSTATTSYLLYFKH